MPSGNEYDELNISQMPAIEVLKKLGYIYMPAEEAEALRGNLYNVILKDVLYSKLTEINRYEYKGKHYHFSNKNINQAMQDIDEALTDGLVKTNEKIYDALMLGRSYTEKLPDNEGFRSFDIDYIDWQDPYNNVFHVVEEFRVEREDGQGTIRPDIVLFVNGIPFAVIECKRSSIAVSQGIEQTLRNQFKEYAPHLFKYVQIVMATNKNETKYATCYTPKKFWNIWKEENESWLQRELGKTVIDRIPTNQDKNIVSLFHPERLLELTRYFILFDNNVKKITRYQQYFAVRAIINAIQTRDSKGNRQSGVIWHTQGSGKSLTMVMLAQYILLEMADHYPKVVLVSDRIELDKQIHRTFNHTRLKATRATSGQNLIKLINDNAADIITSLVHKFDTASKYQKPIESRDVFVLVDESHRTQYGELHIKMKRVFPNACYIGFTGTPLMKKERSTMAKFGKLIHKYTIKDGVEDKTIVPLLYEGKMVEQTVNRKAIDKQLEIITKHLNEKQIEEVKKKWSMFEKIASSEQRLRLIAFDINEHFLNNYKTNGSQFNAMLATNRKIEAVKYLEAFEELGDLNCAVVISAPDQREGYDEVDEDSKDQVRKFWKKMMDKYGDEDKYEDYIKDEFVNGDEIDVLIVVDKLLTGFDAPRATILYIDKQLKEHNLLQAIARVNRLYEGKDYGFIIDYRGLIKELNDALNVYSGAGLENFEGTDLKGALMDIISVVGTLRQAYTDLINIFIPVINKNDQEEYELLLENKENREQFYETLSQFGKHLAIALESEQVYNATGDEEINKYKREIRFYQELRASVKLRYSDSIDHKEYEAKMQKLMDTYIAAEEVIRITNPVDIMNEKQFEEELTRLGSLRAKADAIRTRISKRVEAKYDENPAYYKKFSERIVEVLEEYKSKRISEVDYLSKMNDILQDFRRGYSGTSYPELIKNDPDAQAFFGVVNEALGEYQVKEKSVDNVAALAVEIDKIIEKHSKVDWHDNLDVHNRITQEIDDLLYVFTKEHSIELDFNQIDRIIETLKTVALRRY